MSFEGYLQRLCKNGHLMDADVYAANEDDKCVRCGEGVVWSHIIDTTNGSGWPIDREVDNVKACSHCNSVLELTYKIPKNTAGGDE